ncbi:uncharacterized protein RSE6_03752 [Rhynchosporium secalis]|uniref:Uncharacterized protein n=1 Tax=Rhynchosporium secalis TaxID=38038 RepID=A0A1E1M3L1_RHYSE|nr:uncharacterized protein RSE6_03752 [Rhynchosporium secalis]
MTKPDDSIWQNNADFIRAAQFSGQAGVEGRKERNAEGNTDNVIRNFRRIGLMKLRVNQNIDCDAIIHELAQDDLDGWWRIKHSLVRYDGVRRFVVIVDTLPSA